MGVPNQRHDAEPCGVNTHCPEFGGQLIANSEDHAAFDARLHKLLNMAVHADSHEATNALMAVRLHLKRRGKTFSDVRLATRKTASGEGALAYQKLLCVAVGEGQ